MYDESALHFHAPHGEVYGPKTIKIHQQQDIHVSDRSLQAKDVPSVQASTTAPDLRIPYGTCITGTPVDDCTIVIFGASGDLTRRKLIPALYNLFLLKGLPARFRIVGCARSQISHEQFRASMKKAVIHEGESAGERWNEFESRLFYLPMDYMAQEPYRELARFLTEAETEMDTGGNLIFYLAVPMFLTPEIVPRLSEAGLTSSSGDRRGWSRLLVEKPFGMDLTSARQFNAKIHEHFLEKEVFRIDHYIAKETVQNILMFRFANAIFEPVWNRRYIDHVEIVSSETLGVEKRAGFYEQAGVVRDMLQNHMMQLLSLTAMEPPSVFEADRVLDEKVKVFRSLRPFPVDALYDNLVLGQYTRGTVDGAEVNGYRDEPEVSPESLTPTFGKMKLFVDNWRWQGVPFFVTSGKRMDRKLIQIAIHFREVPHSMFRTILADQISTNFLILGVYPEEKITLQFQTKNPGSLVRLRSVTMDFHYQQNYQGPALEAYERTILDALLGDHMLFWRQDGVEACWEFFEPVLTRCETCEDPALHLQYYAAGTAGPEKARALTARSRQRDH